MPEIHREQDQCPPHCAMVLPVAVLWILPPTVSIKQLIIVLQKASFLPGGSDIWGGCVVVEDTHTQSWLSISSSWP